MYHLEIDKNSARPIYLQIKDQLLAAIDEGQFQPGQKIPSVRNLSEQIGVNRLTVLQALRELTRLRRLFTVTGKGTFVGRVEKVEPNIRTVWGFTETFRALGYQTGSQLIHFDVVNADTSAAKALEVPEKTPLYRLMRKRLLNDQPVALETTFIVQAQFPDLDSFDWSKESLYAILREKYGAELECGYNLIEAASADEISARLLSIPKNSPVLFIQRVTCLSDLRPIEFGWAICRADRMRLKVEMGPETRITSLALK
jgi:GntR family transcriptional regulator